MKYNHKVKYNGKWYMPNEEVPIEKGTSSLNYTKTEISRMSTSDLKLLAKEQEIENADKISGSELKKILIEKFDL